MVTLTNDDLKCIALFEKLTGAACKDCLIQPDSVTFVVEKNQLGKAIGKKGSTISRVRQLFKKNVYIVEYAETPERFAENIFSIARVTASVEKINGMSYVVVKVNESERGAAIGRDGYRVKLAAALLQRHFGLGLKLYSTK